MHRRHCTNCQISWASLPEHELDGPHTCPRCGDQLSAPAPSDAADTTAPARPAIGFGELAA